eukprot:CAMPEP_0198726578 /NCGR_PEP_ID=MMETSP1475-20131203/3590_1 /TAXON_ID= ORGANISM="Unidentified sp., Strain CCMP1999" /NCGR_SAMPLE_ID=MMETSP1475 /ASSEMBLY_ACC=CAM_ASM_001111 /LENGTH=518 /DNA_ID=CAMNT_0044488515 /DNA_START=153 /DNA_END=1706 /DNA_ORIENTATION=-
MVTEENVLPVPSAHLALSLGESDCSRALKEYETDKFEMLPGKQCSLPQRSRRDWSHSGLIERTFSERRQETRQFSLTSRDRLSLSLLSKAASTDSFKRLSPSFLMNMSSGPVDKEFNGFVQIREPPCPRIARHQIGILSRTGRNWHENRNFRRNQDAFVVQTDLSDTNEVNLFAVLDGHGLLGHKVSKIAAKLVIEFVKRNIRAHLKNPEQLLEKAFDHVENSLQQRYLQVIECSGSTCVVALQVDNILYIANIGDSRCGTGTVNFGNAIVQDSGRTDVSCHIDLTRDHTPYDIGERSRILLKGGLVTKVSTGASEYMLRVQIPNNKRRLGLAMTRSFGDIKFKKFGVSSTAEIRTISLEKRFEYLLLASDGLWGVLSKERVSKIINENCMESAQRVAELLTEEAVSEHGTQNFSEIDDITVIFSWMSVDTSVLNASEDTRVDAELAKENTGKLTGGVSKLLSRTEYSFGSSQPSSKANGLSNDLSPKQPSKSPTRESKDSRFTQVLLKHRARVFQKW